jgi:hypothetical protein
MGANDAYHACKRGPSGILNTGDQNTVESRNKKVFLSYNCSIMLLYSNVSCDFHHSECKVTVSKLVDVVTSKSRRFVKPIKLPSPIL